MFKDEKMKVLLDGKNWSYCPKQLQCVPLASLVQN